MLKNILLTQQSVKKTSWYLIIYHKAKLAPAKQASTFCSFVQYIENLVKTLDITCLEKLKDDCNLKAR